jgi:hypothetical protein
LSSDLRRILELLSTLASAGLRLLFAALVVVALRDVVRYAGDRDMAGWRVFSACVAFVSFGMAVPWRRALAWRRVPQRLAVALGAGWSAPGGNVAFGSKLSGWLGPPLLVVGLVVGPWWLALVGAGLPVAAVGLWTRRLWARWPFAALALAAIGGSVWLVGPMFVAIFAQPTVATSRLDAIVRFVLTFAAALPVIVTALLVLRELHLLRRAPSLEPQSR